MIISQVNSNQSNNDRIYFHATIAGNGCHLFRVVIFMTARKIHCAAFRLSLLLLYHYWDIRRYFHTLVQILGCTFLNFVYHKYRDKCLALPPFKFKSIA